MKIILHIIRYLPHKVCFLLYGFMLTAEMGAELLTPFILQSLVDATNCYRYFSVMIACVLLIMIGSLGQSQLYQNGIRKIRNRIWERYLYSSMVDSQNIGELLTLMMDDTERSMIFLQGFTCASLFRAVVYIVTAGMILGSHSLMLVSIVSIIAIVLVLLMILLSRIRRKSATHQREEMAIIAELTAEILHARDEIWSFGQEDFWLQKYAEHSRKIRYRRNMNTLWGSLSNAIDTLAASAAQPLAIIVGICLGNGSNILLFAGYTAILIKGSLLIMTFWNNVQSGIVSGRKVMEMIGND